MDIEKLVIFKLAATCPPLNKQQAVVVGIKSIVKPYGVVLFNVGY